MIPLDGYTEEHEIDGVAILLRPFTRFDRKAIGELLDGLTDRMAYRIERKLVLSRIMDCCSVEPITLYCERLWELAMGINNTDQEIEDETNLSQGVYLVTRYPWMQRTTCDQCRAWLWNPLTGETHRHAGEPPLRRRGEPLCEGGECPRGHWSSPMDLSPKNRQAFRFHKAQEAAGFPDDPIVRRNARLIRAAIRRAEADQAVNGRAGGGSAHADHVRGAAQRRGTTAVADRDGRAGGHGHTGGAEQRDSRHTGSAAERYELSGATGGTSG